MAACDHLGLHDGDFWGPGTYFLPTHYTLCVILFMMQVATHPIVEIALLKELIKGPHTSILLSLLQKEAHDGDSIRRLSNRREARVL